MSKLYNKFNKFEVIARASTRNEEFESINSSKFYATYFTKVYKKDMIKRKKEIEKEKSCMSFAGIFKMADGVFCFADKRSTRNNGADLDRPFVKKLFDNEKITVVTYGLNEIVNFDDDNEPIEWCLNNIVENENSNLNEFIDKFSNYLKEHKDTRKFNFMVLCKNNFRIVEINFEKYNHYINYADINYDFASHDWLKPLFNNSFLSRYSDNTTINELKNYLKNDLIPVLMLLENKNIYSYISTNFDIVEYTLQGTKKYTLDKIDE